MLIVEQNKTNRFILLFAIYIASSADYDYAVNVEMLAQNKGLSSRDLRKAYKYFCEEGFITPKDGGAEFYASITHKGIIALEEVFLDEYKPTYYFPAYREMMR
jgi:predicted transcriptional regulator